MVSIENMKQHLITRNLLLDKLIITHLAEKTSDVPSPAFRLSRRVQHILYEYPMLPLAR